MAFLAAPYLLRGQTWSNIFLVVVAGCVPLRDMAPLWSRPQWAAKHGRTNAEGPVSRDAHLGSFRPVNFTTCSPASRASFAWLKWQVAVLKGVGFLALCSALLFVAAMGYQHFKHSDSTICNTSRGDWSSWSSCCVAVFHQVVSLGRSWIISNFDLNGDTWWYLLTWIISIKLSPLEYWRHGSLLSTTSIGTSETCCSRGSATCEGQRIRVRKLPPSCAMAERTVQQRPCAVQCPDQGCKVGPWAAWRGCDLASGDPSIYNIYPSILFIYIYIVIQFYPSIIILI